LVKPLLQKEHSYERLAEIVVRLDESSLTCS